MSCQTPGCYQTARNHPRCTVRTEDGFSDVDNPNYVEPKTVKGGKKGASAALRRIAATVEPDPTSEGFPAGLAASETSADTWTDEQKVRVQSAIHTVCQRHAGGGEFTTDDIWAELAGEVPVTKGMTAMLKRAERNGWLDSTGKSTIAERGGKHDHGQRLTVWYSLIERTF